MTRVAQTRRLPGCFAHRLEFAWGGGKGPVEGEIRDGLPAGLAAGVVVPAREHLVGGDGGGVLGALLVVVVLHDRVQDVVAAAGDEQQRRPVVVGEVERGRCVRGDCGEAALEQHLGRGGGGVPVVGLLGHRVVLGVGERVVELLGREGGGLVDVGRVVKGGQYRADFRQRHD